jgi:hypothetical protein
MVHVLAPLDPLPSSDRSAALWLPSRLMTGSSRATVVAPEPIIIPAARPTGPLVPRLIADGGRATRPGLKVLFMTGYAEKAASKAFLARGWKLSLSRLQRRRWQSESAA